jgi:hypothetical protein
MAESTFKEYYGKHTAALSVNLLFPANPDAPLSSQPRAFLLCGELVRFFLKVSISAQPPDIGWDALLPNISAAVETFLVSEQHRASGSGSHSSSASGSLGTPSRSKMMKSVESLPLLMSPSLPVANANANAPVSSPNSPYALSNAYPNYQEGMLNGPKAVLADDRTLLLPLELFIEGDSLASWADRGVARIRVALNELVSVGLGNGSLQDGLAEALASLAIGQDATAITPHRALAPFQRLQRITVAEAEIPLIRPLEASVRAALVGNAYLFQLLLSATEDLSELINDETISLENLAASIIDLDTSADAAPRQSLLPAHELPQSIAVKSGSKYAIVFKCPVASCPLVENIRLRVDCCGRHAARPANSDPTSLAIAFECSVRLPERACHGQKAARDTGLQIDFEIESETIHVAQPFRLEIHAINRGSAPRNLEISLLPYNERLRRVSCPKAIHESDETARSVLDWFHFHRPLRFAEDVPPILLAGPACVIKNLCPGHSFRGSVTLVAMAPGNLELEGITVKDLDLAEQSRTFGRLLALNVQAEGLRG